MGPPMGPSIANIFMGWFEERLLSDTTWSIDPKVWRRFIDDIMLLWFAGEEKLKDFLDWLNTQHQSIKFTANYGTTDVPFLDVKLSLHNGSISTDLHVKPTDAHMYVPFTSCHPRHCVRAIPYSQCLRIRRICSEDEKFQHRCRELMTKLQSRGYPKSLVENAVRKVGAIPRDQTLQYKDRHSKQDRTPYVITHNPSNPPLSKMIKGQMDTLHSSRRMKKASPLPPIVGERNCIALRGLIMPSKTPSKQQTEINKPNGCYKCSAKKCIICQQHLSTTTTFTSIRTQQQFTIRSHLTCQSTNIIYLINCNKCHNTQYVGETGKTLQNRFYHHRSDINTNKDTLVARHFNSTDHTLTDLSVTAIEQMRQPSPTIRKRREKYWRHQLRTNYPDGLNVWD